MEAKRATGKAQVYLLVLYYIALQDRIQVHHNDILRQIYWLHIFNFIYLLKRDRI